MKENTNHWQYMLEPQFPFSLLSYATDSKHDELHWHDYLEVALCTGGGGTFFFEKKSYEICPGDVFITNNQEAHVAVAEGNHNCELELLLFLPQIISPPGSLYHTAEYLSLFWYDPALIQHRVPSGTTCSQIIYEELQRIKILLAERPRYFHSLCDASIRKILASLLEFHGTSAKEEKETDDKDRALIEKSLQYIHAHAFEHIVIKDLALLTNLSESRFRHQFKKIMNMTCKEYLSLFRIRKAQELLLSTDMAVSSIISHIGYTNENFFYKLFEKNIGMTPAQYRSEYRLVG